MLQPRIRRYNRNHTANSRARQYLQKLQFLLVVIEFLFVPLPNGLAQILDEPYIVRPTPALRLGAEDLTTVLLINNENAKAGDSHGHGRYLSLRPEIGLLTSTARTFIQEGITTEYATQVVGTTLDNGRLYAQYLKKSSRVLYESPVQQQSAIVVPSVVTSWIGEGPTRTLLQSHNDLINAEAPDWRDIDDRLRLDHNEFVGNTDFVKLRKDSKATHRVDSVVESSVVPLVSGVKAIPININSRSSGQNEENARKLAAQKVLPIGDLPTYTVKNHFEPSGYFTSGNGDVILEERVLSSSSSLDDADDDSGRSPKVFYKEHSSNSLNNSGTFNYERLPQRILSTITYYGFAEFTTIVGDSVIVFSPSTAQQSASLGHVTSIKGEATLATLGAVFHTEPTQQIIPSTIEEIQQIISPTQTPVKINVVLPDESIQEKISPEISTSATDIGSGTTIADEEVTTLQVSTLESPLEQTSESSVEINANKSIESKPVMLSLPTNEEILRLYASLANAGAIIQMSTSVTADEDRQQPTSKSDLDLGKYAVSDTTTVQQNIVLSPTASIVMESEPDLQVHGGATTIFFEDDPFANFLEPSIPPTVSISSILTSAETQFTTSTDSVSTNQANDTTTELDIEVTTTTIKTEEIEGSTSDEEITVTEKVATTGEQPFDIREIETTEDNVECYSRTSQVFLTQIAKTSIILKTNQVRVNESSQISIETEIVPTFDIIQTTKHYCIQTSSVLNNDVISTELPQQLESPNELEISRKETETTSSSAPPTSTTTTTESVLSDTTVQDSTEAATMALEEETTVFPAAAEPETDANTNGKIDSDDDEVHNTTLTADVENDDDSDDEDSGEEIELVYKTLYTTYTYLTTFFQEDSTTVSSHTEVVTNVISSTIGISNDDDEVVSVSSTQISAAVGENEISPTRIDQNHQAKGATTKYMVPSDLENILRSQTDEDDNQNEDEESKMAAQATEYIDDTKYTKTYFTTYTYYTTIFADGESEIMSRTEVHTNYATDIDRSQPSPVEDNGIATEAPTETVSEIKNAKVLIEEPTINLADNINSSVTLVTDVRSSISHGNQQLLNQNNEPIDDQVSSESNTDEIIPSATLLLQTSFTTFTYYTTMYVGNNTNIVSRLETITNVATETLQPTKTVNIQESTLPITYFTTFTYWTKLAKNGEITTISREETISNVVEPTGTLFLEETPITATAVDESSKIEQVSLNLATTEDRLPEPTTYYTTYTYYTTSYELDKTITDSRFETVTNVLTPTYPLTKENKTDLSEDASKTASSVGSDSDIPSSKYILYDHKKIIDADGVSTLYFTTQIEPSTGEDGLITPITSSSSSLYIDETKKMQLIMTAPAPALDGTLISDSSSTRQYKTGLVRLIEGTRIGNQTTTLYQSKVIGTLIDNRYAQIIESTSSFLFEKTNAPFEQESSISPTNVDGSISMTTVNLVPIENSALVEGSVGETTETGETTENPSSLNQDDDSNTSQNSFQSKKRTFAPVIRPFASRNRPTFAPKQKTIQPSSATIITRSDITPTITATPALKTVGGGRYSSSRRGSNAPIAPINLNDQTSSVRRFGSRPLKSSISPQSSLASGGAFAPSRSRFSSSRISPSSTSSARRINASFRPSSGLGFRAGFSTLNIGNAKSRIRPSLTQTNNANSATAVTDSDDENNTEEESSTQELVNEDDNTSESSRRNQNPLLRFRRPLNRPSGFTLAGAQRSGNNFTLSSRRNPLSARAKSPTTTTTSTTTTRPRSQGFQRPPALTLQSRSRPANSLFPPRGLFQAQKPPTSTNNDDAKNTDDNDSDNDNDGDNDSEYDDADDDGEDDDGDEATRRRRSNNKTAKALSTDKLQRSSRIRRQVETTSAAARSRFRFRRPKTITPLPTENTKAIEEADIETTTHSAVRPRSRFGSRYQGSSHSHGTTSPPTTAATVSNHRAIRPTRPTSGRTPFTLREKDVTTTPAKGLIRPGSGNTSAFRRPQPSSSSLRRRPSSSSNSKPTTSRRLKSYTTNSNNNNNNAVDNSRSSGTSRSRAGSLNTSNRSRGTVRSRNRNDYNAEPAGPELGIASITVTHVIPAEVTIPVVNGQVTEYKNIVTGKTSTEVVGPNQYTSTVGSNGLTQLVLTREDTSVNYAGATEVTRYVLHDSATTTVTFTPTTIRGRKTSFSHVLPSTVYSVESVVSTVQPQLSANAPLANILLSQLLLGNIGLPGNPLLGAAGLTQGPQVPGFPAIGPTQPATPVTEYRTHASTYVTTLFDGTSTVLPVTFLGKKILTTVFDTTAQTITATEFITDTIVTTPTQQVQQLQPSGQVAQVNSLLLQQLLLQQQQQQLQLENPIANTVTPQIFLSENNLQDLDVADNLKTGHSHVEDIEDLVPIVAETQTTPKNSRKKSRKSNKSHKNKQREKPHTSDESVITLYVSGRRPGEFSTILSTVQNGYEDQSISLHKRQASSPGILHTQLIDDLDDYFDSDGSEILQAYLLPDENSLEPKHAERIHFTSDLPDNEGVTKQHTTSLESIVGDVDLWYAKSTKHQNVHDSSTSVRLDALHNDIIATSTDRLQANHTHTELPTPFLLFKNGTERVTTDFQHILGKPTTSIGLNPYNETQIRKQNEVSLQKIITKRSINLQQNQRNTSDTRRIRKVLVRKKPLVIITNSTSPKQSSQNRPPKRQRLVIIKHRILTNSSNTSNLVTTAPSMVHASITTPPTQITSTAITAITAITATTTTTKSSENIVVTETYSMTTTEETQPNEESTTTSTVRPTPTVRRKRPKSKKRPRKLSPTKRLSTDLKASTSTVLDTDTNIDKFTTISPSIEDREVVQTFYATVKVSTFTTTLRTRTYTYIVDRVHDNQHEIQLTSTLTRVVEQTLPITLTFTNTLSKTTTTITPSPITRIQADKTMTPTEHGEGAV